MKKCLKKACTALHGEKVSLRVILKLLIEKVFPAEAKFKRHLHVKEDPSDLVSDRK